MSFGRKRTRSAFQVDKLLRDDFCEVSSQNVAKKPMTITQVESSLRTTFFGPRANKIRYEYTGRLDASSLLNQDKVIILGDKRNMDAFVGTSTGILKSIDFSNSKFANFRPTELAMKEAASESDDRANIASNDNAADDVKPQLQRPNRIRVTAMCFGYDQNEVLTVQSDRQLCHFNALTSVYTKLFSVQGGEGIVRGLHAINEGPNTKILTAVESGAVRVWNPSGEQLSSENWNAGENLVCLAIDPCSEPAKCATGGRENPLKLWDLSNEQCIFTAKNVKNDYLDVRVPIWVTNCRFLGPDAQRIVTTTGHHQIRVYDPRVQRRPVVDLEWPDEPIQALSTCYRENFIIVGNNKGEVALFDLRSATNGQMGRLISKYRGFAGSVRAIVAHPFEPHFISCGIDRHAIVHNIDLREIVKKIYCKVQLTCALLRTDNSLAKPKPKKYGRKLKS